MNVLVFDGAGVSQTSLRWTLHSLRALLASNYAVQRVSAAQLATQPWSPTAALLVIPGGRDVPYVSALAPAIDIIRNYVHGGGRYLGLCAGAYFASRRVEWEVDTPLAVEGDRPLGFFPGVARGAVYPGFQYDSEAGAKVVAIKVDGEQYDGIYFNGGGEFADASSTANTRVFAMYADSDKVAAVKCEVGQGAAVLWGLHPEYPLGSAPAASLFSGTDPSTITSMEEARVQLMKMTLRELGLTLPGDMSSKYTVARPQVLVGRRATIVPAILRTLESVVADGSLAAEKEPAVVKPFSTEAMSEPSENPRLILAATSDATIPKDLFDVNLFFQSLPSHQQRIGWRTGEALFYTDATSSTQTLLTDNPTLMATLPTPIVSLASHQLSGRGRGGNTWVSPSGCLQFSILLRVAHTPTAATPTTPYLPPASLVYLQYLFALSVAQAARHREVLGEELGENVRIKWPNDIYAFIEGTYRKIGGILVNTSFRDGLVDIVVGSGTNVLSAPPIPSMAQIGRVEQTLSMEQTAAMILSVFHDYFAQFVADGGKWDAFSSLYLKYWLHTDQEVTITTVEPPTRAGIECITSTGGLLRTIALDGPQLGTYIDLQPDGNSFDMLAGLIQTKT